LLGAKQPLEVRLAAIRALSAHTDASVPDLLLKQWKTFGPALRREVVEALTRGRERTIFLLDQIEKETIKPGDLDANRTRQLIAHRDPAVRDRARKLLARNLPADRKEVLRRYRAALEGKGDVARGRKVFEKNCATCHRVDDLGVNVGPDISDTRTKTAEMLLTDILNPNQAIDANFVNYQVTTRRGQVLTGIILAETASSVTLKRAENQTDVVLRQDIEEIVSTGVSLMPEGVEKAVSIDEMRDLLAFLKNWRYRE
jgi:putative heme-binding domain-containing protein